jgi:hypothetical protein
LPEQSQSTQPGSLIGKIEAQEVHVTVNNISLHRETRTVNAPTTYNSHLEESRAQYVEILPVVYVPPSRATAYYEAPPSRAYDSPFYSPQRKPSADLDRLFGCGALLLFCVAMVGAVAFLIGWAWHALTATSSVPVQVQQPPGTLRIEVQGTPRTFDEFLKQYEKYDRRR